LGEPRAYKLGFEAVYAYAIDDLIGGFLCIDGLFVIWFGVGPFRVVMGPIKAVSKRGSERGPGYPSSPSHQAKKIHFKISQLL